MREEKDTSLWHKKTFSSKHSMKNTLFVKIGKNQDKILILHSSYNNTLFCLIDREPKCSPLFFLLSSKLMVLIVLVVVISKSCCMSR
jgi:hypothetical protein